MFSVLYILLLVFCILVFAYMIYSCIQPSKGCRSVQQNQSISQYILLRSLKGRCHRNQLKSQNRRFRRPIFRCRAAIPKRIAISQFRFQKMTFSALCRTSVNFGPLTPEFYAVNNDNFCDYTAKHRHITPNISEYPGLIFTYFTSLVGI